MRKLTILIITISLLASSCTDVIDLEVEQYEPMVAVEGEINDKDEKQILKLSISKPYFQEDAKTYVEHAQVVLFEDELVVGLYKYSSTGIYEMNFTGQVGKEYKVEITLPTIPGYPNWSGKLIFSKAEFLSPVSEITEIRSEYKAESTFADEGYYLFIDTYDRKGKGNYYRWRLNVNGEFSKDTKHIMLLKDDLVDGNLIEDLDLTYEPFKLGEKVTVYQQSISKTFYQYLLDIYNQALTQEAIFDAPPYNPQSNLNSDIPVVGYFNASAYSVASIIVEEE